MKHRYSCFKIIFPELGRFRTEKILELKYRRLQKLKEIEALHGANTEPAVLIQIEDLEKEINTLQAARQIDPEIDARQKQKCRLLLMAATAVLAVIIGAGMFALPARPTADSNHIPVVKNFSVEYPNQPPASMALGDVIKVKFGQNVFIKPVITPEQGEQTTWFIARGNKQLVDQGIKYIPPDEGTLDVLTVQVKSSHGTQETYASLHIIVIHN